MALALALAGSAAGCYGSTRPVVKLGLIAPFEELYREDGYAVLHAVRLALNEHNGRPDRRYNVALVALNDNGRPEEAALQAQKLGLDPAVWAVVGPIQSATAQAAGPALAGFDLPWLALAAVEPAARRGGWSYAASPAQLAERAVAELVRRLGPPSDRPWRVLVAADQPSAAAAAQATGSAQALAVEAWPAQADAVAAAVAAFDGVVWLGDAAGGAVVANARPADRSLPLVGGPELASPVFRGRNVQPRAVFWLNDGVHPDRLSPAFVAAYEALAGRRPTAQAALAYDATRLALAAIEAVPRGGPTPRATVRTALETRLAQGWEGVAGVFRWDALACDAFGCGRWVEPPSHVQDAMSAK
ncbi:MAG: ABC transporter substrate-binding protein [Anaerolineae bacterium]|nr:ABC transporter substrate-binding protein [Anaerolineae bacterium]